MNEKRRVNIAFAVALLTMMVGLGLIGLVAWLLNR